MALRLVLSMSVVGGVLSIILLLLKPLTKRFVSWQYYVWLAVLLVMLIPVPINMMSGRTPQKGNAPVNIAVETDSEAQEDELGDDTLEFQAESPKPQELGDYEFYKSQEERKINIDWNKAAAAVWLMGIAVFWGMAFISYGRFVVKMRSCPTSERNIALEAAKSFLGIKRRIEVRISEDTSAPMLTGVFKPVVYIPARQIPEEELYMVFLHELTHYKRHDLLYKWFALLVNGIHWFNPLSYAVTANINRDCEVSCDEQVTRKMNDEDRQRYMETILKLASARKEVEYDV